MTDQTYGSTSAASGSGSTAEVAQDQARTVAEGAKQGSQQVAAAVKDQTREVAGEAKAQTQQLLDQVRSEASEQASAQQKRAASGLRSLGEELGSMAEQSSGSGIAADLARQASDRARSAATWLESREPGDVLSEVADFARRRPGTFLAAAAAVGFLGGRLTRGLAAGSPDVHSASGAPAAVASERPETPAWTPVPTAGHGPPQHGVAGETLGEPQSVGIPGRP